jgi:hypothetical protein
VPYCTADLQRRILFCTFSCFSQIPFLSSEVIWFQLLPLINWMSKGKPALFFSHPFSSQILRYFFSHWLSSCLVSYTPFPSIHDFLFLRGLPLYLEDGCRMFHRNISFCLPYYTLSLPGVFNELAAWLWILGFVFWRYLLRIIKVIGCCDRGFRCFSQFL